MLSEMAINVGLFIPVRALYGPSWNWNLRNP